VKHDGKTAIVVLGGTPPTRSIKQHLPEHHLVIAADSGLHGAVDLGLRVNVVIGDMDSVDRALLAAVEAHGVTVTQVPHDKDQTDAELALLAAVDMGASRIVVITKGGGRGMAKELKGKEDVIDALRRENVLQTYDFLDTVREKDSKIRALESEVNWWHDQQLRKSLCECDNRWIRDPYKRHG